MPNGAINVPELSISSAQIDNAPPADSGVLGTAVVGPVIVTLLPEVGASAVVPAVMTKDVSVAG